MSKKRFLGVRFFISILSLFGGRALCSFTGVFMAFLFSFDPIENKFDWDFAIVWSIPFLMIGLIIGFLIDSSRNNSTYKRNKAFEPPPSDGNGDA